MVLGGTVCLREQRVQLRAHSLSRAAFAHLRDPCVVLGVIVIGLLLCTAAPLQETPGLLPVNEAAPGNSR